MKYIFCFFCLISISVNAQKFKPLDVKIFKPSTSKFNFLRKDAKNQLSSIFSEFNNQITGCIDTLTVNTNTLNYIITDSDCVNQKKELLKTKISKVITKEDLDKIIKNKYVKYADKLVKELTKTNNLSTDQKKILEKLVNKETHDSFLNYQFTSLNSNNTNLAEVVLAYEKALSNLEYFNLLNGFDSQKVVYLNHSHPNLNKLITRAKEADIPISKINKLIQFCLEKQSDDAKYKLDFQEWKQDYVIYMHPNEYNLNTINQDFRKKLVSLLTKDEFTTLFNDAFLYRYERAKAIAWEGLNEQYDIPDKYKPNLRSIVDYYAEERINVLEYNKDNEHKAYTKVNELLEERKSAIHKALVGFEIIDNKQEVVLKNADDSRLPLFTKRAQEAGVSQKNIDLLVKAIKLKKKEDKEYGKKFNAWKAKNIVYYHDNETGNHATSVRLKKRIAAILTVEQFEKMFFSQFQERIERRAKEKIRQTLLKHEELTNIPEALSEVKQAIKNNTRKEMILYNFYVYDRRYAMQKVNALKYKNEKALKNIINKYIKS